MRGSLGLIRVVGIAEYQSGMESLWDGYWRCCIDIRPAIRVAEAIVGTSGENEKKGERDAREEQIEI